MNQLAVYQTFTDRLDGLIADAHRIAHQAWSEPEPDLDLWTTADRIERELIAARERIVNPV